MDEFTIEREFDAPRELVFEAWSRPEHVTHWWGRMAFTMPVCEMDFRAGGTFRFCMRAPGAREYWVRGTYREIVAPERIVFDCALENEKPNHEALFTVTFLERKGRTSLTLRSVLLDPAQARKGAEGGWSEALQRLAAYVEMERKEQSA